jgi:hypothetical protein
MDKNPRKVHVVGQRRAELDIARFADALISFALHRVHAKSGDTPDHTADARPDLTEETS